MKCVEDIFLKLEGNKNISEKSIVRYFHLIRDKKNIRWIIEDYKQLSTLLKDWRPFNKYSNFFWKIIIILHEFKLLRYIPISSYKKK